MKLQSVFIPAQQEKQYREEYNKIFKELIEKQHQVLDIKPNIAAVYDSKEDDIVVLYSTLIMYAEKEEEPEYFEEEQHENKDC